MTTKNYTFTEDELFYYNEKLIQDYNDNLKKLDRNSIDMLILSCSFIGEEESLERFISELRICHEEQVNAAYEAQLEYKTEKEGEQYVESGVIQ